MIYSGTTLADDVVEYTIILTCRTSFRHLIRDDGKCMVNWNICSISGDQIFSASLAISSGLLAFSSERARTR